MGFFKDKFLNSISRRFVVLILLVSSGVTVVITAVQLYWDYRVDLIRIEERIAQIERSNLDSLTNAVWVSNQESITLQLEGILKQPDMQYLKVIEGDKTIAFVGEPKSQNIITRSFSLRYPYNDRDLELGHLYVVVSLEGVYRRLFNKVLVILGSQGVKTFIVSFFIILIFHFLVARHLEALSKYARALPGYGGGKGNFALDRKRRFDGSEDELDLLIRSFNTMTENLKAHEQALQQSHDRLEVRVAERTTELRHTNEELQKAESHLRVLVDTVFDGVISIDIDGIIRSYSPAAERIFQYSEAEVIGLKVESLMPEPYHSEHDGYIEHYLDTGIAKVMGAKREVQGQRKDKTTFPMDLALGESMVGGERVFVATIRDITLRKQQDQALSDAKEQAEAANKAKSEFLSSMSHELRTPLNGILGFAQLLEYDPKEPLSATQLEYVEHILQAGRHLHELINEILDLAKIEAGRIDLECEPLNPVEIISECLGLMSTLAEKNNIQLTDMSEEWVNPIFVLADYTRLKQVLINLVSNAVKYNRSDGAVRIGCSSIGKGFLRFSVSDTGSGLSKDQLAQLFQPFNRLGADKSEIEGSGIGLAITRNLVEMMGGRIGVESTVGMGSTFWADLPVAAGPAVPQSRDKPEDSPSDQPKSQDTLNVRDKL